jgi:hypothetical protein
MVIWRILDDDMESLLDDDMESLTELRWGEVGRLPQLDLGSQKYLLFFSGENPSSDSSPGRHGGCLDAWLTEVEERPQLDLYLLSS